MVVIKFDNIEMKNIKLNRVQDNDISQLLLKKSEDEILNLKISDKYQPNQKTVYEVLELKIKKRQ